MTTTLFVDIGIGLFGANGTTITPLNTTIGTFRDIFSDGSFQTGISNTGSDLSGEAGLVDTDSLDFQPLNYDFDGDGAFNLNDILDLEAAIFPIIERALEPYDIDVARGNASNLADALTAVQANTGDLTGEHDAYVFAMDTTSNRFTAPNNSVGDNTNLFGIAAARDLTDLTGNNTDEAVLTFADTIFSATSGIQGTANFNNNLATRLAYTITHEAFHTFAYRHTPDESSTVPQASANERLLTSGDVIRRGSVTREDPFIVTRFNLLTDGGLVNNYDKAVNDTDIGLRDDDADGTPNLAYATGTGAHDQITLADNGSSVNVTVAAFSNVPRTAPNQIRSESYSIDVSGTSTDTEGEILVDASINSDEVVVDARIGADLRLRGGEGRDTSVSTVAEADRLTLQSNGLTGNYTPGTDAESGTINYAGGAQIDFSEFEEIEADNIPIVVNNLTLSSSSITENDSVNLSGDFINIDTDDTHQVVINWGDDTTNTVINLAAGQRTFNASHRYEDDGPFGLTPSNNTPSDLSTIQVTVTDEDNDSGNNQTSITVNDVAPELSNFSDNLPGLGIIVEGDTLELSANYTDVGTKDFHTIDFDWDDGSPVDSTLKDPLLGGVGVANGSHVYTSEGVYTASLTVTDDDTLSDEDSVNVIVARKVDLDWKPNSNPSAMNFQAGKIPVAILGEDGFNVRDIDVASIRFDDEKDALLNGGGINGIGLKGNGTFQVSYKDVSGDGMEDLVAQVDAQTLGSVVNPNQDPFLTDEQIYAFGAYDGSYFFGMQRTGDPIKIVG